MHSVHVAGGQARSGGRAGHSLPRLAYLGPLSKHSSNNYVNCFCAQKQVLRYSVSPALSGMLQVPTPYPTALFIRDKALVVNLESIRMIISADQVSSVKTCPLTYIGHCICAMFIEQRAAERRT